MLHPDRFLHNLLQKYEENTTYLITPEQKESITLALKQSLGFFEQPISKVDLDVIVREREQWRDVFLEQIEFTTIDGLRMSSFVIVPKSWQEEKKALPGILLWHGHGSGSRSMLGKDSDSLALQLSRKNMVVVIPEIIGFGERLLQHDLENDPGSQNSCYSLAVALLTMGKTLAGLRTIEAIRAVDYLLTRPEVDPDRIGTMGFSGGGTVATLLAALDERIQACVVASYANTFRGSILSHCHCVCNYIPGILRYAEMPALLGLIAPRHLFVESGRADPIFPIDTAMVCIQSLQETYRLADATDRFSFDVFEGGHTVHGDRSINWLADRL